VTTLYRYTDVDGDRISVFDADIPGHGEGVNIRVDPAGASIPASEIPNLLRAIAGAVPHCGYVGSRGDFWCIHPVSRKGDICDDHKTTAEVTAS
jgi:hypothetical protein